jgi:hypothetical protein
MTWLPVSYSVIELFIVRLFLTLTGICTLPFLSLLVLDLGVCFGKIMIKNTTHIKRRLSEPDLHSLSNDLNTNNLVYSRSLVNLRRIIAEVGDKSSIAVASPVGVSTGRATFEIGNEELTSPLINAKIIQWKLRKSTTDSYSHHHSKGAAPPPPSKLLLSC